jgi:hypothetical protein
MPAHKKKWALTPRTVIDIVLGAACIILLIMMLGQLEALKKLEADVDRLRIRLNAADTADKSRPADRPAGTGTAAKPGKP